MTMRYALYWTPPAGEPLAQALASVLGYDPASGAEPPHPEDFPAGWPAMSEEPRRYGAHATLKAPFRLAPGKSESDLLGALSAFNSRLAPVPLGALRLSQIKGGAGTFLALRPETPPPALAALERGCVLGFEAFRAALTPDEIARRRPDRLTERQRDLLESLGYPYVLDQFRFHVTLSGPLADPAPARAALERFLDPRWLADVTIARVSLLRQDMGGRFRLIE